MSQFVQRAARSLGAARPLGTVEVVLFVPTSDRGGKLLRGAPWVRPALEILGRLFGGATAYPKGLGVWRDDDAGRRLVFDRTSMVFSHVAREDWTELAIRSLRAFLHRMGREARQGEVGLVIDGEWVRIKAFDEVRR